MITRRLAVGAIALFAATGLILTGCGSDKGGAKNSSAGAGAGAADADQVRPAREVMLASSTKLAATTYKMTITSDGLTAKGKADPANKKFAMDMTIAKDGDSVAMSVIAIDKDMYLKMDLGKLLGGAAGTDLGGLGGDSWMHINMADVSTDATSGFGMGVGNINSSDPFDVSALFGDAADVKKIDDRHYTATIDMNKMAGKGMYKEFAKGATAPARVDITLDDKGRLIEFTMHMTVDTKPQTVKIEFSDFGTPVDIQKPAKVTDMPSFLGGGQGK